MTSNIIIEAPPAASQSREASTHGRSGVGVGAPIIFSRTHAAPTRSALAKSGSLSRDASISSKNSACPRLIGGSSDFGTVSKHLARRILEGLFPLDRRAGPVECHLPGLAIRLNHRESTAGTDIRRVTS